MSYGIKLHCWGEWACFTRPEMKVERVSYDAMTPSAARGVVEAVYWKPEIHWHIDRITVLKPIKFTSVRRNPKVLWGLSNAQLASLGSVVAGVALIWWASTRTATGPVAAAVKAA